MLERKILSTMAYLDISQKELAEATGISTAALSVILHPKDNKNKRSDIKKGINILEFLRKKGADINEIFDNK